MPFKSKVQNILIFILLLLNTFINLIGGTTGGNNFFIASFFIALIYGATIKFRFRINFIAKIYFIIVLFSFLSLVYAKEADFVLDDLPRVLSNFLSIILVSAFLHSKKRLIKLLNYYVFNALLLAIPNLIFTETGVREMFWGGVNPVGSIMFFAILFSTLLIIISKTKKHLLLILIFLAVILVTQSQKVTLTLVFIYSMFLLYILFYKSLKQKLQYLMIGIAAFATVYLLINKTFLGESFSRTQATIQQLQTGEVVEGSAIGLGFRDDLLSKGVGFFLDKPILGHGLNQSRQLFLQDIGRATYTHNTTLELLISFGLIITFLYYIIYFILVKRLVNKIKYDGNYLFTYLLISIIGVLIVSYYQKMFYDVNLHLFLLVCLFLISNKSIINNENKSVNCLK